jgi:hypothetical protein
MNIKAGDIYVTESMIAGGSLSCQTCDDVSSQGLLLGGTLFWLCEYGHENKVTLYE